MGMERRWKNKIQDLLHVCQGEIIKTTAIGKKMLTATKTTSKLHQAYERLGQITSDAIRSGELKWDDPMVLELVRIISDCQNDLMETEDEVKNIKDSHRLPPG